MTTTRKHKRILRRPRVRAHVSGTPECPRASVFRSIQHTYVQFIDDASGRTLLSFDDTHEGISGKTKKSRAQEMGRKAGEELKKKGIVKVVFDRGGFHYHGRVKAVAEGLRESGISL